MRRVILVGAGAAVAAAAAVGGTLVMHHGGAAIPQATMQHLVEANVEVTPAAAPSGVVSTAGPEAYIRRTEGSYRLDGEYVVNAHVGGKRCVCWLIVYLPEHPMRSEAGIPASFEAALFDARTGTFVFGVGQGGQRA